MENLEYKKIIAIFSAILILTFWIFWITTFTIISEKNQVQAKLEENKEIITKVERINILNKNNDEIDFKIKEISENIKNLENQKTLLEENKEKNLLEKENLKNTLVK